MDVDMDSTEAAQQQQQDSLASEPKQVEQSEKMEEVKTDASSAEGNSTNGTSSAKPATDGEAWLNNLIANHFPLPLLAPKLLKLCTDGLLTQLDVDERMLELLGSFPMEHASRILKEIEESKLYGVHTKSQYLMAMMRNYRERIRALGSQAAMAVPLIPGPDPDNIKAIVDRSGYKMEVTVGQRKYHSPPGFTDINTATGEPNNGGCVYIGQIPREIFEDTLIPLFETIGQLFDFRLMMDPVNGRSKGYAFATYCDKKHCEEAAKKFDGYEITPTKTLKVNISVPNTRLFIGNIPKTKSKDEILADLKNHLEGVVDVLIYGYADGGDARRNRGFCFADFVDHRAASDAKRKLLGGKVRPWNNDLQVDWAEQQDEPDEEIMSQVKVLYVRNIRDVVTEAQLQELFEKHGEVEKAKKLKDYAFIHFKNREDALKAMAAMKGTVLEDREIEISLARPQGDLRQKKRLAFKRGFPGAGGPMPGYPPGAYRSPYPSHFGYPQYGEYGRPPFGGSGGIRPRGGPRGGFAPRAYGAPPAPPLYGGGGYADYGAYDYGGYEDPYGYDGAGAYDSYAYYGGAEYADPYAQSYMPRGSYPHSGRGFFGAGGGMGVTPGMVRGARGMPGGGRGKRPGGDSGGPNSKRGGGAGQDFSADMF